MSVDAEKSRKTMGLREDSQVPISAELQKFFTLSRKYQTEFSYIEEYHRSRKFKFHEINLIEEFITYTLFFKKCNEGTTMPNMDEKEVVKNITKKMIQESQKYNCEVHFNVIWVYYFTFRNEEMNSLPVFKIHTGRSNGDLYLDAFSKVFQTWDRFLDGPCLGESLMCVPKNGEYCFDGDKLNLEFVLTKSTQLECRPNSSLWVKLVIPVYQGFQDWVMKIKSWLSRHPEIYSIVMKFLELNVESGPGGFGFARAILLAYLSFDHKINIEFTKLCFQAVNICFTYILAQENFAIFNKFLTEIKKIIARNWIYIPEARELLKLLSRSSKDWIEISYLLCCLIKKIHHSQGAKTEFKRADEKCVNGFYISAAANLNLKDFSGEEKQDTIGV